jgi:hypothetical protein
VTTLMESWDLVEDSNDLSVLIPWRTDNGPRQAALDYILPLWRATGAEVCIGQDDPDGPFNCARAQNRAFRKATRDKLVMFGADCVPDFDVLTVASRMLERSPWLPLFQATGYYSRDATAKILRSEEPLHVAPFEHLVPFCTGVVGLSRAAYLGVGGMDERFAGWGMEDAAFRRALYVKYGDQVPLPFTLQCLWHEESARGHSSERNWELIREYEAIHTVDELDTYLTDRGSFVD